MPFRGSGLAVICSRWGENRAGRSCVRDAAMTNKLTDIQWICTELDDVAVLLRTHGIQELANQLDAIREDLRSSPVRKLKKKWARHSTERPALQP
jgi:hypothetical protein